MGRILSSLAGQFSTLHWANGFREINPACASPLQTASTTPAALGRGTMTELAKYCPATRASLEILTVTASVLPARSCGRATGKESGNTMAYDILAQGALI